MNPTTPETPAIQIYPILGSEEFPATLTDKQLHRLWYRRVRYILAIRDPERWVGGMGIALMGEVEILVPIMCRAIDAAGSNADGPLFDLSTLINWCREHGFRESVLTMIDTYRVAAAIAGIELAPAERELQLDRVIKIDRAAQAAAKAATIVGLPDVRAFRISVLNDHQWTSTIQFHNPTPFRRLRALLRARTRAAGQAV